MDSLEKCSDRFREIENLKKMIQALHPPMTKDSRDKIAVLNRVMVVMLCSHIQGYLEDVVIEFVDGLCKSRVQAEKVPGKLKVTHMMEYLKDLQYEENWIKKLFADYNKLWIDNQILEEGDIDGERIVSGFGNPGSKEVERLLGRIGVKIWNQIPPELKGVKDDLDAIVRRRNDIAHGALESSVTFEDASRYHNSAVKLTNWIDSLIEDHLKQIINA